MCCWLFSIMNTQRQLFEQTSKQMNDDLIRPKRVPCNKKIETESFSNWNEQKTNVKSMPSFRIILRWKWGEFVFFTRDKKKQTIFISLLIELNELDHDMCVIQNLNSSENEFSVFEHMTALALIAMTQFSVVSFRAFRLTMQCSDWHQMKCLLCAYNAW